jgi:hypothetical protein
MLKISVTIVAAFVVLAASTSAQAQCTPEDQLVIKDLQAATMALLQRQPVDMNWLRSRSQALSPSCQAHLNPSPQPLVDETVCTPRQQQAMISCNAMRGYKGNLSLCDCHRFPR